MKYLLLFLIFFFLTSPLLAIDEESYVGFVADSTIAMHTLKDNPRGIEIWADQINDKYPDFEIQDLDAFETSLAQDPGLKSKVYKKIIKNIRSQGYSASLVETNEGTIVEIE